MYVYYTPSLGACFSLLAVVSDNYMKNKSHIIKSHFSAITIFLQKVGVKK